MTDTEKAIIRRLDGLEKILNQIYKDREIMEDTHVRMGTSEDRLRLVEERLYKLEKHLIAELKDVQDNVVEVTKAITDN